METDTKDILQVEIKVNGQHKRYALKDFGVNFDYTKTLIYELLIYIKAPLTKYTFFLHGKLRGVDTKNFSVKMFNNKYLHISFNKAGSLTPIYGSLGANDLKSEEMQNLFSCLKTWEHGSGKKYDSFKDKKVKASTIIGLNTRVAAIEEEANEMLGISLPKAFHLLKNSKLGTPRNDLYRKITQQIIDFSKKNKKSLSADISVFQDWQQIIEVERNEDHIYANQLVEKLIDKFVYLHMPDIRIFFTKHLLDFYKSPESFDMHSLANKKSLWQEKILQTLTEIYVPVKGKRKFYWSRHKEKDFKNICEKFCLNTFEVKDFRDLYFQSNHKELMSEYAKSTRENLDTAEKLKEKLSGVWANYYVELSGHNDLEYMIVQKKKTLTSLKLDISKLEQEISKLLEI